MKILWVMLACFCFGETMSLWLDSSLPSLLFVTFRFIITPIVSILALLSVFFKCLTATGLPQLIYLVGGVAALEILYISLFSHALLF